MKAKHFFLLLFAVTLTALMLVPQVVRAELLPQKDSVVVIEGVFHPGEIVNLKGWSDKILIGKPFEHTGTPAIGICPTTTNTRWVLSTVSCPVKRISPRRRLIWQRMYNTISTSKSLSMRTTT